MILPFFTPRPATHGDLFCRRCRLFPGLILVFLFAAGGFDGNLRASAVGQETTAAGDDDEPAAPKRRPGSQTKQGAEQGAEQGADGQRRALPRRRAVEDFPRDLQWMNTQGPLRKQDLKGKFVLLDFWTYCCINCMHILPELKKLEQAFPNELVVIGVHSAKFDGEKDSQNISDAILRYEIEHPVVNDSEREIWNNFAVQSWPTIVLLDPEGYELGRHSGEFRFEMLAPVFKEYIPIYREHGLLDLTPIRFDLLAHRQEPTPLRYPGKVLTDDAGKRVFIADSNHNRIVVAGYDGALQAIIGSGELGSNDGSFESATFHHPQGMALHGSQLYIADTENHLIRRADLNQRTVVRVAGIGEQATSAWPGMDRYQETGEIPSRWVGPPLKTALNSPWDLWAHDDALWIAMAGPHQIWRMPLNGDEIGPFAGNGREDIVDGRLLPKRPYELGYSSFAQPSGLTSDGKRLFVADSEGSSIRAVPFDVRERVETVVGTAHLPAGRLFHFGDVDGPAEEAQLQHALGVAYSRGKIYVADTYNNKIRVVDAKTGTTSTLAGTGKPGGSDDEGTFDEPAGIAVGEGIVWVADTNNHRIRKVDPSTGEVRSFEIPGLTPPERKAVRREPDFSDAKRIAAAAVRLKPIDGRITLQVQLVLPLGWKLNPRARMAYHLMVDGEQGPLQRSAMGEKELDRPRQEFEVTLPVDAAGTDTLQVGFHFYYCEENDQGLCKVGSVLFTQPITVADDGQEQAKITHSVSLE